MAKRLHPLALAPSRQLSYLPTIDRSAELSKGLVFSAFNTSIEGRNGVPYDVVTRRFGIFAGTSTSVGEGRGQVTAYNGTDSYSELSVDLRTARRITLSFWARWDDYTTSRMMGGLNGDLSATVCGWYMFPNSGTGRWLFGTFNANTFCRQEFARPTALVFNHFAFRIDLTVAPQLVGVFVNGIPQTQTANGSQTMAAGATFTPGPLQFFKNVAGGAWGTGRMTNVNIHTRLLTDADISSIMVAPYQMFLARSRYAYSRIILPGEFAPWYPMPSGFPFP